MRKIDKSIFLSVLFFLAGCQSIVSRNLDGEFNSFDKDKSQTITWDEYSDIGHSLFKRLDYNSDGVITGKEDYGMYVGPDFVNERDLAVSLLTVSLKQHAFPREVYDVNHDRVVTLEEYDSVEREAYNKIDMNKDGTIAYGEYIAFSGAHRN